MPNIVQVEFFHVGGADASSIEEVMEECDARIAESLEQAVRGIEVNAGIKTTLRFFDATGDITALALENEKLSREEGAILDVLGSGTLGNFRFRHYVRRRRRVAKKQEKLKARIAVIMRDRVFAPRASLEMAISRPNHSFRFMHGDEKHDVFERVSQAKGFGLFLLAPNTLLADKNTVLASVF